MPESWPFTGWDTRYLSPVRPDLLVQRKLFPEITSSTVIAWQRNLPNSHAVNKFIEIISSVATHDAGTSLISLNACKA